VDVPPCAGSCGDRAGGRRLNLSNVRRFDRLRSLSYADTHVIMICFSVERPESLENVEAKWIGEVEHFCPGVKVILVALKCDLREDPVVRQKLSERGYPRGTLSYEDGLGVAQRIHAQRYLGE
jgi:Rho family protein